MTSHRTGRSPSQRQLRVGEELRHALASLLQRGGFRDPELRDLNVTVTEVRVNPDLKNATAFVTPLGGGQLEETVAALRRAAPFFRAQIARTVRLRYVPRLTFEADTSFDYAERIDRLLQDPDVRRDLEADDGDEDVPIGARMNGTAVHLAPGHDPDEAEDDWSYDDAHAADPDDGDGEGGGRGA